MFGLGFPEIILILVIVILIFGTSRIPELGTRPRRGHPELQEVDQAATTRRSPDRRPQRSLEE